MLTNILQCFLVVVMCHAAMLQRCGCDSVFTWTVLVNSKCKTALISKECNQGAPFTRGGGAQKVIFIQNCDKRDRLYGYD
jgi:hypothetical protein